MSTDPVEPLADALRAGHWDAEQAALVRADPAALLRLRRRLCLDAGLCELLRSGQSARLLPRRLPRPARQAHRPPGSARGRPLKAGHWWLPLLAAGILLAIALAVWPRPAATPSATTAALPSVATLIGPQVNSSLDLPAGTQVQAPARLRLADGHEVELQQGDLALAGTADAPRLHLHAGALAVSGTGASRLVLTTPEAQVRVLGTQFTLRCDAGGTDLHLITGRVGVSRSGSAAERFLDPGASWHLAPLGPLRWSVDAQHPTADGFGRVAEDGIHAAFRKVDGIPTWLVELPVAGGVPAPVTVSTTLSLARSAEIAVLVICLRPDGTWATNRQATLTLPAGQQTLLLDWADLPALPLSDTDASGAVVATRVLVMTWAEADGLVVQRVALNALP